MRPSTLYACACACLAMCFADVCLAQQTSVSLWERVNATTRPVFRNSPIVVGGSATADALRILEPSASGSNYTAFKAGVQAANLTYTLPTGLPSVSGQVLSATDAGVMSWATIESGITIGMTAITGGGANRILFESATNKVTSSANLNWDGTSLNVPSPAKIVTSSINAPIVRTSYINTSNDNYTAMYLDDANGRVGVNKSVPGAQLHTVAGSATTIGAIIQLAAAATANALEVNSAAGSDGDVFKLASNGSPTFRNTSINFQSYSDLISSGGLRIVSDGNGRLGLDYSGKGIQATAAKKIGWVVATVSIDGTESDAFFMRAGVASIQLGENAASPISQTFKAHDGLGTNIAGAAINIAGGKGTGTGLSGVVNIQTAPAGLTGSALNALVTAASFDASTVSGNTRMFLYDVDNATLERVTVGIADSAGVGYKVLRIPN